MLEKKYIKRALEYAQKVTGNYVLSPKFFEAVEESLQSDYLDRRYKLMALAATNSSAILQFRKQKFYILYEFNDNIWKINLN